jgi:lysine-N-methylase
VLNGVEPGDAVCLSTPDNPQFLFDFFKSLDYMHGDVPRIIKAAESAANCTLTANYDNKFENLALYNLYRYYLNAVDSMDVLNPIKRIVCEFIILNHALAAKPELDLADAMQKYSKEIEHSYENSEEIEFEFMTNPLFSPESLSALLK